MIQLLLLALLLFLALYGVHTLLKNAPQRIGRQIKKNLLWLGLIVLLILAATGRMNWLIPLVGALFAVFLRLVPFLIQFIPLLEKWLRHKVYHEGTAGPQNRSSAAGVMSRAEALEILGLQPGASRDDIIAAHRRLMQKLHPDRGGSDYLAAKINKAKETLLNL